MANILEFDGPMVRNMLRVFQDPLNGTPMSKVQWLFSRVLLKIDQEKTKAFLEKCVARELNGTELYRFYEETCKRDITLFINRILSAPNSTSVGR